MCGIAWPPVGRRLTGRGRLAGGRRGSRDSEIAAKSVFRAPPAEWVAHRLQKVDELLESATERSALLLRKVLGAVKLTPITPEVGRSYYQAETAVEVLALLDEASDDGSNSLQQWRRGELNPRPKALDRKPLHA